MRPLVILAVALATLGPAVQSVHATQPVAIVTPHRGSLVNDQPLVAGIASPDSSLRITVVPCHPPTCNSRRHMDPIEPGPGERLVLTTTADATGVFSVGPLTLPATRVSRYWEVVAGAVGEKEPVSVMFHQTADGFGIDAPVSFSSCYDDMTTGPLQVFDVRFVGGTPPFTYTIAGPDAHSESGTTSLRIVPVTRPFTHPWAGDVRIEAREAAGRRALWSFPAYIGGSGGSPLYGTLDSVEPASFRPSSRPGLAATTISLNFGGRYPIHVRLSVRDGGRRWIYTSDGGPCPNFDAAWQVVPPGRHAFTWNGWDNTLDDNTPTQPIPFPPSGRYGPATLLIEYYSILDPDFVQRIEHPIEILPWRP